MGSTVSKEAPLVSVNNVSFNFGTTKVLLDVTFSISCGDFVAIIGPNGSGKTTLLRIIVVIAGYSRSRDPGNILLNAWNAEQGQQEYYRDYYS